MSVVIPGLGKALLPSFGGFTTYLIKIKTRSELLEIYLIIYLFDAKMAEIFFYRWFELNGIDQYIVAKKNICFTYM